MKTTLLVPGTSLMHYYDSTVEPTVSFVASEWLMYRPHVVLWADDILMAKNDFRKAHEFFEDDIQGESVRILLDSLKEEGILKTFDPSSVAPAYLGEAIQRQVLEDERRWKVEKPVNPETGKIDMSFIRIEDLDICPYRLESIYSSLAYARLLNTQCLLDGFEFEICRRRFGEVSTADAGIQKNPIQNVLEAYAPNVALLGKYAIHSGCDTCANEDDCSSSCIEETEEAISTVLELRQRDEMIQLKKTISQSVEEVKREHAYDEPKELEAVLLNIKEKANRCKRRLLGAFPHVKRWARITTAVSVPLVFAGAAGGNGLVSLAGLGLLGSSQMANEVMGYLESKYRWVAFLDEIAEIEFT